MKLRTLVLLSLVLMMIVACVPKVDDQAQTTDKPEPVQFQEPTPDAVMHAVYESARLLGVPERLIRVDDKGDRITVRMPHDGDEMELALAGSVVEGQVELAGAKILRSESADGGWVVEARCPDGKRKLTVTLGGGTPLAIVVDDFGMISGAELQAFCRETPPEITFAIIPGTPNAQQAMQLGHDTGHELMLHMPMQAMSNAASSTPNDLVLDMTPGEIRKRVQGWVDELPLCVGANNHQGSAFTASAEAMTPVLEVLRDNGYYFIDSRTYKDTQGFAVATRLGVPAAERRSFLDVPGITDADLDAKIEELKKLRGANDTIVAITHCYPPGKLVHLKKLIERVEAEGFVLVPASQVVGTNLL